MTLDLQLTTTLKEELLALAAQFYQELEDRSTPAFPTINTLVSLKDKLKAALFEQAGFGDIWEDSAANSQLLCLHHPETKIRNLPWQVATEERSLLAVAKSFRKELSAFQPLVGFPLKVLVMVSSPEGEKRLAYEEEELQLLRAFSPLMAQGLVQVHFTEDGSVENLKEKLEENRYHILHYTGHGLYHKGQGTLALEDPITGKLQVVTAKAFNEILEEVGDKGHRPDLVVLSACQTAQGQAAGDLSGVADTLMQGGSPAVIAMAASIRDDCAIIFAASLYGQLSKGYPLGSAFQKARLAVRNYELSLDLTKQGLAPGQWLIPQLLLNKRVEYIVASDSPKDVLDFKHDVALIKGERALLDLRVRPKNYVFVGRRREKRQALQQLKAGKAILLRGQGGVGKTALAEHLSIRMMAGNQNIKVFTFSEKAPAAQSLLDLMKTYLTKEKRDFKVLSELVLIDKQSDKFLHLLGKVSEHCDPLFLFDNIETLQRYDQEASSWVWNQEKHEDVFQLLQILDQHTSFPLIITGRYPIAEFKQLEICNMNTAPFGDFFRKCHQLSLKKLAEELGKNPHSQNPTKRGEEGKPLNFEEVIRLLHTSFGGNYRALEFFDELYTQRKGKIFQTLEKLADFKAQLEQKEIREGLLSQMSENLILKELLGYLDEKERDTLFILAQFNIPVLPLAIGMQRESADRSSALQKIVDLTLAEKQRGLDDKERYYVMPLIKEWLKQVEGFAFAFNHQLAGDYHHYAVEAEVSEDTLSEYKEAFESYHIAKSVDPINEIGDLLCNYYYQIQQFRIALNYGTRTEEIAGNKTHGRVYSNLGLIFQIFGHLDFALQYQKKSLEDVKRRGDRQGEAQRSTI